MSSYYLGIDIGSVGSKAVIIDADERIIAWGIQPSGTNYSTTASALKEDVLQEAGLKPPDLTASAATGTGGRNAGAGSYHGVIVCNAHGVNLLFPDVRTIVDIGGQGSQLIDIDEKGRVINFNISEICATGSARLLQLVARILQRSIEELGPLSMTSTKPSSFSTSCTVFLETEVITRIAQGDRPEDIVAGIHRSIADKVSALARGVTIKPGVAVIGGGALDIGLVKSIEDKLGLRVVIPENPRIIAALGASLLAREHMV
jgi:predicted CoA-substrate-specific enzyme activase